MTIPALPTHTVRSIVLALAAVASAGLAACAVPAPTTVPVQPAVASTVDPAMPTEPVVAVPVTPTMPALADPSKPVAIVLRDFAFDTSAITFTTGVTYNLVITNTGVVSHELRVLARGESQMMMDLGVGEHMAMGSGHEHASQSLYVSGDELPAGSTVERQLYFERPGEFEFGCHLPAHLESGMLQYIDVIGESLAPLTDHDITVDLESMKDMPCHRMAMTIMGDCTPEDIERLKQEILGTPAPDSESGGG